MKLYVIPFFCLLFNQLIVGKVKPNSLFSDHMVLQKGVEVSVWGRADEDELVTVTFNGQSVSGRTKNGKWMVKLKPLPYINTPSSMIIMGSDTVIIKDILVGEVWLCSGQSNMERQLGPRPPQPLITDWEKERDAADFPEIREYYVPLKYSKEKVDDVNSRWTVCSPETVSDFSAVGYFFAKHIYKHLNVPVGIIFSAHGGTPAEDWTSTESLKSNPDLAEVVNNYDNLTIGWKPDGKVMSGLYNGMIYPLIPFGIKGVAWYQGESNNDYARLYKSILSNMIKNWREDFNQGDLPAGKAGFPFLIVQVTPHKEMFPELREAQFLVSREISNSALVVTTDCGDVDIHSPNKQPVGERLALCARALAYGEAVEYSGPIYQSYTIEENKVVLQFSHANNGLTTKDKSKLKGFTIAGADKKFITAVAEIKGNKVIVYNDKIDQPLAVRYGWENYPDVNLFNAEGLPASPFRTDPE